jgi:phage shock protein PspC (stress-responsive transcriptional regulator)
MSHRSFERLRRRFTRDPRNGWIGGVCEGVARTLQTDPAFLRVGFIVVGLMLPKLAIGVYLVAWILLEEQPA